MTQKIQIETEKLLSKKSITENDKKRLFRKILEINGKHKCLNINTK